MPTPPLDLMLRSRDLVAEVHKTILLPSSSHPSRLTGMDMGMGSLGTTETLSRWLLAVAAEQLDVGLLLVAKSQSTPLVTSPSTNLRASMLASAKVVCLLGESSEVSMARAMHKEVHALVTMTEKLIHGAKGRRDKVFPMRDLFGFDDGVSLALWRSRLDEFVAVRRRHEDPDPARPVTDTDTIIEAAGLCLGDHALTPEFRTAWSLASSNAHGEYLPARRHGYMSGTAFVAHEVAEEETNACLLYSHLLCVEAIRCFKEVFQG